MPEAVRTWMEIVFNLAYLLTISILLAVMWSRHRRAPAAGARLRRLFMLAFALLAAGDLGHVGFRALALASGRALDHDAEGLGFVGLGALATAVTVTGFYVVMLLVWAERFGKRLGRLGAVLLGVTVLRVVILALPHNQWDSVIPVQPWGIVRNLPLMVLGLGVAGLVLRDARRAGDATFTWVGWLIVVSFAFYLPVITLVQVMPALGMLMIPKTIAYVAIAVVAVRGPFAERAP